MTLLKTGLDLLGKISLKKKAFILSSLNFIDLNLLSHLTKVDIAVLKELKKVYTDDLEKEVSQLFSSQHQKKISKKTDIKKKRRFGNHAGYREDIKENVKSKTEANIARYLTKKYGRSSWEYESTVFELDITTKTGRKKNYTPDFKVSEGNSYFFIEVKPGFLPQSRDKAKLKSFMKKYPKIKLIVITYQRSKAVIQWCQKNNIEIWYVEELLEYCNKHNIELE